MTTSTQVTGPHNTELPVQGTRIRRRTSDTSFGDVAGRLATLNQQTLNELKPWQLYLFDQCKEVGMKGMYQDVLWYFLECVSQGDEYGRAAWRALHEFDQ